MKTCLLTVACLFSTIIFAQQAPPIQWQKALGYTYTYVPAGSCTILPTPDGGYVFATSSAPNGYEVTSTKGEEDYLIVKTNSTGIIEWQKTIGGSSYDEATDIQLTPDGGYIVAGNSLSKDGDVTGHHGPANDWWIVKLTGTGDIQWQKSLGGPDDDEARSVQPTPDGGYIVTGSTRSTSGNVSGNHGYWDAWVVKLSKNGVVQWQKCYGGAENDEAYSIQNVAGGGYIIVGYSFSNDGTFSGNKGNDDAFVLKINNVGDVVWQKLLGGTGEDEAHSIQATTDGGYIIAGSSSSNDGDLTRNRGQQDVWVFKLNNAGNIQWQKSYGGTLDEGANCVKLTSDGGYIIAAHSNSKNGDVAGNYYPYGGGQSDFWIIKLAGNGGIQWQKNYGGTNGDVAQSIAETHDGGYIISGTTNSLDHDVIKNHGDTWIVKLSFDTTDQVITFLPFAPINICNKYDFPPVASVYSGLPVTFTSSDTSVVTIVSNRIHIKAPGTSIITAIQNGNAQYHAATPVTQTITVAGYVTPSITIAGPAVAAGYNFSRDTGISKVGISTGSTTIIAAGDVPATSPVINLPFNFYFAGAYYSAFSANANGLLRLGSTPLLAGDYPGNTPASLKATTLMVWANKLSLGANGNVRYKITGNEGTRKLVVEWNVRDSGTSNYNHTFQAWLYEKDNIIKFVYGQGPVRDSVHPYGKIGIVNSSTDYLILSPDFGTVTSSDTHGLNTWQREGTAYTFSTPGDVQICPGTNFITITATALNGGMNPIYIWKKNDSIVARTSQNWYADGDMHNGDSIWCLYQSSACVAKPVVVSNKIRKVITKVTPAIVIEGNTSVCIGDTASFNAMVNNVGAQPAYQWKLNNVNVGTGTAVYANNNLNNGDSVWCVVTPNKPGCYTSPSVTSNKKVIPVYPYAMPNLTIATLPRLDVCSPDSVKYAAVLEPGAHALAYQWMKNNAVAGDDKRIYIEYAVHGNDSVWCTATGITGCVTGTEATSSKVIKRVFSGPPAKPSAISGPATVSAGQAGIAYSVIPTSGLTYVWSVSPGVNIISGQGTNSITVNWGTTNGHVSVKAKDACGTSDTSRINVWLSTGFAAKSVDAADDATESNTIQVYPNPAGSVAYVVFTATGSYKYGMKITDELGRVVLAKEGYAVKGTNKIAIDVSRFAKSVYFIQLAGTNNTQRTLRLIVGK